MFVNAKTDKLKLNVASETLKFINMSWTISRVFSVCPVDAAIPELSWAVAHRNSLYTDELHLFSLGNTDWSNANCLSFILYIHLYKQINWSFLLRSQGHGKYAFFSCWQSKKKIDKNNSVTADLENTRLLFLQANFIQLINSYCKTISLMGF